jgi:hypothetical protein
MEGQQKSVHEALKKLADRVESGEFGQADEMNGTAFWDAFDETWSEVENWIT